jgi:uncharacterized protein DUF2568
MRTLNLAVRFILELCALAALAYWGVRTGVNTITKIGLAAGSVLVAVLVWGIWVAPRAPRRLADPWRLVPEFAVWTAAAVALWTEGLTTASLILLPAAATGRILIGLLGGEPVPGRD